MTKDTFCILPHIHQMIRQDGTISLCCTAIDLGLQKDDPTKSWNSDYMKDVRNKLSNGEKIKQCRSCWDRESKGFPSMRQDSNNEWGIPVNNPTPPTPIYLDLRLSNLCNLKCRMCNPVYSSQIAKEYNTVNNTWSDEFIIGVEREFLGEENNLKEVKPIMWDKLKTYIPGLQKIDFTGGEPTLVPQVKDYLKLCIDSKHSNHIDLVFTTNLTNINQKLIDLCLQFRNVHWGGSIDGYGAINDYIRSNSSWNAINNNLKKLMNIDKFSISINHAISIYNILNITELLNYIEKHHWSLFLPQFARGSFSPFIILNLLQTPDFMSIQYLPTNIKNKAISKLEQYKQVSKYYHYDKQFKESINSIIKILQNNKQNKSMLSKFKRFNDMLDSKRNTTLKEIIPEIHQCLIDM